MKAIDFIFVGSPKNQSYKSLEENYHKKIKRYIDSNLIYLKDSLEKNIELKKKKETEKILENIKSSDVVVLCDERGKSLSSVSFSKKMGLWQIQGQRVVFVVGGAFGIDFATLRLCDFAKYELRLSDFTLPHELARVCLLEQVYRAYTISRGEKYHH